MGRGPPADLFNTARGGRGLLLAGVVTGKLAPLHPLCLVSSHLAGTRFLSPEPSLPNLLSASPLEGTSFLAQNAPASREGSRAGLSDSPTPVSMAQTSGSTPRRPKQREQQGAVGGGDHLAGSDSTNVNEGTVGRRCARNCEVQTGYLPWFPLWVTLLLHR